MDTARSAPRIGDHAYIPLRQLVRALREEAAMLREGPPGPVLDLGCGQRPYEELFGARYVGIDLGVGRAAPDCAAAAEQLPFRSGSVAAVVSTQHLEHADDPALVLREARRVLDPAGTLLLSTHGVWVHHPDPHDYWRWTEEGLRRLVEQSGFRIVRTHQQGDVFSAGALMASYPLGAAARSRRMVRLPARALMAVINLVLEALAPLAARLPRHYGAVNYLVVARPDGTTAGSGSGRADLGHQPDR